MNGIDNIAGYTLTVGEADFVITDSIATYDPIIGNLEDGDERRYKAQFIDPSFSSDYETGVGSWHEGSSTFLRTTVKTSSKDGDKVDFGPGAKIVFIVSDYESLTDMNNMVEGADAKILTAAERTKIAVPGTTDGTLAAGDDPRFESEDVDDMTAATSITGTENIPASQGGDPVRLTPDQILGDPFRQTASHEGQRARGYSNFSGVHPTAAITDGQLAGLEPFVVYIGGAGASAGSGGGGEFLNCLLLSTGTTNAGYGVAQHTDYPQLFIAGLYSMDMRVQVKLSAIPTSGQDYTFQSGFINSAPALAAQGIYFELTGASSNWFAVVKNAGGTERVDTGIVAVSATKTVLRVRYDHEALESQFWIDGVECDPILDSTRAVGIVTIGMATGFRKTNGTTARTLTFFHHMHDITKSTPADFL